jgi:hypothetical protein
LSVYGDPIPYEKDLKTLRSITGKDICEHCRDRALARWGAWVVGYVPSKNNPDMVHLTDPVCENWRLWYGKPLCWQHSDHDTTHGYLIVPNLKILAALLVLEFPVYYKPFDTVEEVTVVRLDRTNGWDYFIVPPSKAIRGETLKGVIIDAQLGLLKQIQGELIILERGV